MKNNSRIDTDALLAGMIGKGKMDEPKMQPEASAETRRIGRTPNTEKNDQVSIYMTEDLARELRMQSAEKIKEKDRSAIARTGIEIALALSNEVYLSLKKKADQSETTPGQIIQSILSDHFSLK